MPSSNEVNAEVVTRLFRPGDEAAFRKLNERWIKLYFEMEEKDEATFADPQKTIIERGGEIIFADLGGQTVGCCALLRTEPDEFEVAKMAVDPEQQGHGIGRRVLQRAVDEAKARGARRLYLETNHQLKSAIRLYESVGFRHLDPARVTPSPYSRADVYMELIFNPSS